MQRHRSHLAPFCGTRQIWCGDVKAYVYAQLAFVLLIGANEARFEGYHTSRAGCCVTQTQIQETKKKKNNNK